MSDESDPIWLSIREILAIHSEQIAEFGGKPGILNMSSIEASVDSPINYWHYTSPKPSIPELGAKLGFSLIMGHGFNDGNKRVGADAMETFINLNDWEIIVDEYEFYEVVIKVASSDMDFQSFAAWVVSKSQRICNNRR